MQSEAGVVMTAVVGLWIAYLVPHRLRYRQQLLESRTEDRFSEQLRVVRVATATAAARRVTEPALTGPAPRVLLHPRPARRTGGGTMDRPHAAAERLAADAVRRSAAEHARRVAHLQRRRAATRRRALLTAVLGLATLAGWGAVAGGAAVAVALVPTVGLGGVLLLGRRAVVAAARADAEWAAGAADRVPLPRGLHHEVVRSARPAVVGRAVRASDARTEVLDRVPTVPALTGVLVRPGTAADQGSADTRDGVATRAAAPARSERTEANGSPDADADADAVPEDAGDSWSPVPVPRPSYTLKPAAPRREPAPLPETPERAAVATEATEVTGVAAPAGAPAQPVAGPGGLDLDAILARRRASGE